MNHTIKTCLAGAALALTACGPGGDKIASGKQGAAEALYAASAPTKSAADRNAQPVDVSLSDLAVDCRFGGKATLKDYKLSTETTIGSTSLVQHFTLAYDNCATVKLDKGIASLNGSFVVAQDIGATSGTGGATANVKQSFKGKVTFSGSVDDFIDADVTEEVDATSLAATGASVLVKLVGKLTDSSGTYDYNESVSVTAGNLSVQVTKN